MRRMKFGCENCKEMEINGREGWGMWCGKFDEAIDGAKYKCKECIVNCGYEG